MVLVFGALLNSIAAAIEEHFDHLIKILIVQVILALHLNAVRYPKRVEISMVKEY